MSTDTEIRAMVEQYFDGLHHGDVSLLAGLFHADCELKTPNNRRSRKKWLSDVASRPVPYDIGHPWSYQILWLELEGDQAMVKVRCPLPHGNFTDYLGFLREGGVWKIVNKMYALEREEKDHATD